MMALDIELVDVSVDHGAVRAVDGVDLVVAPGSICGLFGRNGAGKTTLLTTVAAYRRPTAGTIRVGGREPYEDASTTAAVAYVPAARAADQELKVREALEVAAVFRPSFEMAVAERLLDRFAIATSDAVCGLSTGQRSAFTASLGLASRAPVTLLDEAHLGMDAVARSILNEEVLVEYAEHPRTMVLSTHLIEEVAPMLDDVVVLDRGRVLAHHPPDELRARGANLAGPVARVDALLAQLAGAVRVLSRQDHGRWVSVAVLAEGEARAIPTEELSREPEVEVAPLPLQDLFVHLTSEEVAP
jgi:ABC-2 type transport system ATP-binding protein